MGAIGLVLRLCSGGVGGRPLRHMRAGLRRVCGIFLNRIFLLAEGGRIFRIVDRLGLGGPGEGLGPPAWRRGVVGERRWPMGSMRIAR